MSLHPTPSGSTGDRRREAKPYQFDSGFWIFRTMTGLTEVETLETKSVMMAIMGFSAMAITLLASRLVPLV